MIQIFLADKRADQPEVVQEVLADLKKLIPTSVVVFHTLMAERSF